MKSKQKEQPNYLNGGGFANRPKSLRCSICGREFGTASLEIHQKSCIKKYQNDLVNMDVHHRVHMPSAQEVFQKVQQEKVQRAQPTKSGRQPAITEQPSMVMALVPCRRCGRRFNPDRIRKHESVCIGPEPDVAAIKQKQIEINKKEARSLRPRQTGKWKQQHLEFQAALKEMRKYKSQSMSSSFQQPKSNNSKYHQSAMRPDNRYPQSNQYQAQTIKTTHKQPQQQSSANKSRQDPKRQSSTNKPHQFQDRFSQQNEPRYQAKGSGPCIKLYKLAYQIATSNVSTFSLFTNDGKPKNYDQFQRSNPYAQKAQTQNRLF